MSDFKVGMRVVYAAGTTDEDHGTITEKVGDTPGIVEWDPGSSWWVRWDSVRDIYRFL